MKLRPDYGYSVSSISADSRDADTFGEEGIAEMLVSGRMELFYPEPTKDDREQYGLKKRGEWDDGCQASCEYRDSFVPMMNYLWPVDLAYGRSASQAADLMNKHAGATSLVMIGDETYIAMTGGGFDMSWHLAAAYVCCGCIPPTRILQNLKGSPFHVSESMTRAILVAAREGVRFLQRDTKRLAADIRATAADIREKAKSKKAR